MKTSPSPLADGAVLSGPASSNPSEFIPPLGDAPPTGVLQALKFHWGWTKNSLWSWCW